MSEANIPSNIGNESENALLGNGVTNNNNNDFENVDIQLSESGDVHEIDCLNLCVLKLTCGICKIKDFIDKHSYYISIFKVTLSVTVNFVLLTGIILIFLDIGKSNGDCEVSTRQHEATVCVPRETECHENVQTSALLGSLCCKTTAASLVYLIKLVSFLNCNLCDFIKS